MAGNSFGTALPVHQLGRKPRSRDRLRRRRRAAAPPPDRGRHPGLAGQAPARPVALHHPAAGAGHGEDPVRRVRGRLPPARRSRCISTTTISARKDYGDIKDKFRPGHADYTYQGSTACATIAAAAAPSARETAMPCRRRRHRPQGPGRGVTIRGALVQIGPHTIDRSRWDWDADRRQSLLLPRPPSRAGWEGYLDDVRKRGSSSAR